MTDFTLICDLIRQDCEALAVNVEKLEITPVLDSEGGYLLDIAIRSGRGVKTGAIGFNPDRMTMQVLQQKVRRFTTDWGTGVIF